MAISQSWMNKYGKKKTLLDWKKAWKFERQKTTYPLHSMMKANMQKIKAKNKLKRTSFKIDLDNIKAVKNCNKYGIFYISKCKHINSIYKCYGKNNCLKSVLRSKFKDNARGPKIK